MCPVLSSRVSTRLAQVGYCLGCEDARRARSYECAAPAAGVGACGVDAPVGPAGVGGALLAALGLASVFPRVASCAARFAARLALAFALPLRAPPRAAFCSSVTLAERAAKN